jgi:hypothetical protein
MLRFTKAELDAIALKLRQLDTDMRAFAGANAIPSPAITSGMTVYPGGGNFASATALKTKIESMATSFGQEYLWLRTVIDKLATDTVAAAKTMDASSALALDEVSDFRTDFSGTLSALTEKATVPPADAPPKP